MFLFPYILIFYIEYLLLLTRFMFWNKWFWNKPIIIGWWECGEWHFVKLSCLKCNKRSINQLYKLVVSNNEYLTFKITVLFKLSTTANSSVYRQYMVFECIQLWPYIKRIRNGKFEKSVWRCIRCGVQILPQLKSLF